MPNSRWCSSWAKALGVTPILLLLVVVVIGYFVTLPESDSSSPTPNVDRALPLMVALGDSFIAGEGAGRYLTGTSSRGTNMCHRANSAYPFLVARKLGYRLVNAACSGALTSHVVDKAQHEDSPADVFGGEPQIDHLSSSDVHDKAADVDVVVLSIGGNNAEFSEIVKQCLLDNCIPKTRAWMDNLEQLAPQLYDTYTRIGALVPKARKIVMPYPDLIAPGSCLHELSAAEVAWVRSKFLPRLDRIIASEATNAGWEVVDDANTFVGARICEPGVPIAQQAANIFKLDQLSGSDANGDLVRGSFHPKPLGHQLLAEELLRTLGQAPPALVPCAPYDTCPPPPPNPDIPPPGTHQPFPEDSPCVGDEIATQELITVQEERRQDLSAQPGSTFCYREWAGDWKSSEADRDGIASISTSRLADQKTLSIEVLTVQPDATWKRTVINATPRAAASGVTEMRALRKYAVAAILLLIATLAVAALPFVMCRRRRRRSLA